MGQKNGSFPLHLGLSQSELINYIFLVDALNFNFWTKQEEPKFCVTFNGNTRFGYLGMVQAINRAISEGKPMYDPDYYGSLTEQELSLIFHSDTASSIPLLSERARILKEISAVLKEKFSSSFTEVLKEANFDAAKLVQLVVDHFPCFQDEALYYGKPVSFYKRAQILAADLDLLFSFCDMPRLANMDCLTMFADYRVPQVLLHFGVLVYSAELITKLRDEFVFDNGSVEEVEIRACSIEAVERLVQDCRRQLCDRGWNPSQALSAVSSVYIDYFLWEYRLTNANRLLSIPFHKTRCIFY
ncbi:putative Queuosine Q salvage protein family [Trinorchestia longiramus]|nr:putative Queuosine Q salvage protein family [Trinorchestia longiramus]